MLLTSPEKNVKLCRFFRHIDGGGHAYIERRKRIDLEFQLLLEDATFCFDQSKASVPLGWFNDTRRTSLWVMGPDKLGSPFFQHILPCALQIKNLH